MQGPNLHSTIALRGIGNIIVSYALDVFKLVRICIVWPMTSSLLSPDILNWSTIQMHQCSDRTYISCYIIPAVVNVAATDLKTVNSICMLSFKDTIGSTST